MGCGGGPIADRRLDPPALYPDGHLDGYNTPSTTSPGMRPAPGASWFARRTPARRSSSAMRQGDFQLSPAAGVAAVMAWWRGLQARVVQIPHRTNVGAAWRQPSRAPRQSPPAVTVMCPCVSGSAAPHCPLGLPQPVQLRRQRPSAVLQILQVAVAVERPPVDLARSAAPIAGLGGARTGVVGLRPASAATSLVKPRAGRDGDLPGPAQLPAAHEPHHPWPGCQAPTNPPGGHGQAEAVSRFHRTPRR